MDRDVVDAENDGRPPLDDTRGKDRLNHLVSLASRPEDEIALGREVQVGIESCSLDDDVGLDRVVLTKIIPVDEASAKDAVDETSRDSPVRVVELKVTRCSWLETCDDDGNDENKCSVDRSNVDTGDGVDPRMKELNKECVFILGFWLPYPVVAWSCTLSKLVGVVPSLDSVRVMAVVVLTTAC